MFNGVETFEMRELQGLGHENVLKIPLSVIERYVGTIAGGVEHSRIKVADWGGKHGNSNSPDHSCTDSNDNQGKLGQGRWR